MWQALHNLTLSKIDNYPHLQEENSHTNEKQETHAKPLLTFIVIWVEQIWYTPKGKSLLSKAAQKRMTDSWMVSVKQLLHTLFSLNCSQSKHSMSSCLTKMFLYSGKLAGWKSVFIWALIYCQLNVGHYSPEQIFISEFHHNKRIQLQLSKTKQINEWIPSQSCKC